MPRILRAVFAIAFASPLAAAQSFNVDVGANQVYGTPSSNYGGGAAQPGQWNPWTDNLPIALAAIDGAATGATARYLPILSTFGNVEDDIPGSSGGDERLIDDRRESSTTFGAIADIEVAGLWNGDYEVYTYAFAKFAPTQTFVRVWSSPDPPVTLGFGTFPGGHVQNVTFALHRVAVTSGTLVIEIDTANNFFSTINGFQIRWLQPAPSGYCTAKLNSIGCAPVIGAIGTSSASAGSGFTVSCNNVLNAKPGLLLYSVGGAAASPFHGGWLCLAPAIQRCPGVSSGGSAPPAVDCTGAWQIDFNAFVAGALGGNPSPALSQPGTVTFLQWWGRDPGFAPPDNVALSSGLQLVQGY